MRFRDALVAGTLAAVFAATTLVVTAATTLTLYQGAQITGRLRSTIDTGAAHVGDRFVMDVVPPYPSGNPAFQGAVIVGEVTSVRRAAQGTKPQLQLAFNSLRMSDGSTAGISATISSEQKKQQPVNYGHTALTALGGMIVGNMIGKTIFHTSGGGAIGLAGGALYGANQKQNFQLPSGSNMSIVLNKTVTIRRQAR